MLHLADIDLSDCLVAEIAVVDASGAIVRCNRKWGDTARAGMLAPKPAGWNYIAECEAAILRGCREAPAIRAGLRGVLRGEKPTFIATYSCPFNGLHHWFQVMMSPLDIGGKRHAVLMHVDVSALQTDALTGLPNRAMFDAQLELAVSTARELDRRTGIVIVDMNNLKAINDLHGHQVGDEAIKALAAELKRLAGPDSVVARIGGDEFGVVLPISFDTLFTRRMRAHFDGGVFASIGLKRKPLSIAASVGVAFFPEDGNTAGDLFKSADRSMYAQKEGLSVA